MVGNDMAASQAIRIKVERTWNAYEALYTQINEIPEFEFKLIIKLIIKST